MRSRERPGGAEVERGVTITGLPAALRRQGLLRYASTTPGSGALVASTLTVRHLRRPYAVIQVNTMPDFLVFAAIVPKLLGSRVIAYMKEPTPGAAETIYGRPGSTSDARSASSRPRSASPTTRSPSPRQLKQRLRRARRARPRTSPSSSTAQRRADRVRDGNAPSRASQGRGFVVHLPRHDRGALRPGHDRRGGASPARRAAGAAGRVHRPRRRHRAVKRHIDDLDGSRTSCASRAGSRASG